MKILDRYVIRAFVKNYLITFFVLVGLYVVLDMIFQFDELAEVQAQTSEGSVQSALSVATGIVTFYGYRLVLFFVHLAPIIPGVAASFTLLRLTRFNELTAWLAAGVPLLRVAAPIVVTAVVLSFASVGVQELVIPNIIPELMRRHDEINAQRRTYPVPAMQDSQNRVLMAGRFHPADGGRPARIEYLDVVERDEALLPVGYVRADAAEWDPRRGAWVLTNGVHVAGLRPHERPSEPQPVEVLATSITPDEIVLFRSGDYVDMLSTSRINQLLDRPDVYGTTELLKVKHTRFTQPILNIILLLLAIPAVLLREPSGIKVAAVRCIALTGLCLGTIFLTQSLAGQTAPSPAWVNVWPALMAWTPVFIFGPVAVYLLDRVKT